MLSCHRLRIVYVHRLRPPHTTSVYKRIRTKMCIHVRYYPVKVIIDTIEKTIKRIGHLSSNTYAFSPHDMYEDVDVSGVGGMGVCEGDDSDDGMICVTYILVVISLLVIMMLLRNYDQYNK